MTATARMRFLPLLPLPLLLLLLTSSSPFALAYRRLEPQSDAVLHGGGSGTIDFTPYASFLGPLAPFFFMTYLGLDSLNTTANNTINSWFTDLNTTLNNYSTPFGNPDDYYLVPQIGLSLPHDGGEEKVANGSYDHAIQVFVYNLEQLGRPSFVRIGYECNGVPWNGYKPDSYKGAFQRVAAALHASPVLNSSVGVATVWDVTCDISNKATDWYPGDNSVDWYGVNIYSDGSYPTSSCVKGFLDAAVKNNFPVMLGEVAPRGKFTNDTSSSKGYAKSWFDDYFHMFTEYKGTIKATSYIDRKWFTNPSYPTWEDSRIETPGAQESGISALYVANMGVSGNGSSGSGSGKSSGNNIVWVNKSNKTTVFSVLGV